MITVVLYYCCRWPQLSCGKTASFLPSPMALYNAVAHRTCMMSSRYCKHHLYTSTTLDTSLSAWYSTFAFRVRCDSVIVMRVQQRIVCSGFSVSFPATKTGVFVHKDAIPSSRQCAFVMSKMLQNLLHFTETGSVWHSVVMALCKVKHFAQSRLSLC